MTRFCSAGLVAGALFACSPTDPEDCPSRPHPTFRLIVEAPEGPLPDDTLINVSFGAGEEEFDVMKPDVALKSVFCEIKYQHGGALDGSTDGSSGGAGTGAIESVVCELWTDGPASVLVKAGGYPDTERELSAERDKCGIVMTEQTIVLERGD